MKPLLLILSFLTASFAVAAEEFGATGIWVQDRQKPGEPLRTGKVSTNSPAHKAGIRPGLFFIAINGTNIVNKSPNEFMTMLRGPVGATVTLDIADAAFSKTNRFAIKRGRAVIRNNRVVEITE